MSNTKIPIATIDCTPTWSSLVTVLVSIIEDRTHEGREEAIKHLRHMAQVADMYVAIEKKLQSKFHHSQFCADILDMEAEEDYHYYIEEDTENEVFTLCINTKKKHFGEYNYPTQQEAEEDVKAAQALSLKFTEIPS